MTKEIDVETDFVVLGNEPTVRSGKQVLYQYKQDRQLAAGLHIPILEPSRF